MEPPGLYVLASVVVTHALAEEVRDELRQGLRPHRKRFHWRDEQMPERESMAKRVGALDLVSVVAVATPIDHKRPERARRFCITRLLWELEQRQVLDVLFESRQNRDRDDRDHIVTAQRAGHVNKRLMYGFQRPLEEPLLWLPDLVAGSVAYSRSGLDHQCLQLLGTSVVVVDVGSGT